MTIPEKENAKVKLEITPSKNKQKREKSLKANSPQEPPQKKAPKSQLLLNQSATSTTSKENTPIISLVLAQMLPNAAKKTLVWLGKSPEGKKIFSPKQAIQIYREQQQNKHA